MINGFVLKIVVHKAGGSQHRAEGTGKADDDCKE